MLGMAPDYDHLTVIQKVEVFEHAMDSTSGELGWVMAGRAGCRCGWLGSKGFVGGRDAGLGLCRGTGSADCRLLSAANNDPHFSLPSLPSLPPPQARTCTRCCG